MRIELQPDEKPQANEDILWFTSVLDKFREEFPQFTLADIRYTCGITLRRFGYLRQKGFPSIEEIQTLRNFMARYKADPNYIKINTNPEPRSVIHIIVNGLQNAARLVFLGEAEIKTPLYPNQTLQLALCLSPDRPEASTFAVTKRYTSDDFEIAKIRCEEFVCILEKIQNQYSELTLHDLARQILTDIDRLYRITSRNVIAVSEEELHSIEAFYEKLQKGEIA